MIFPSSDDTLTDVIRRSVRRGEEERGKTKQVKEEKRNGEEGGHLEATELRLIGVAVDTLGIDSKLELESFRHNKALQSAVLKPIFSSVRIPICSPYVSVYFAVSFISRFKYSPNLCFIIGT